MIGWEEIASQMLGDNVTEYPNIYKKLRDTEYLIKKSGFDSDPKLTIGDLIHCRIIAMIILSVMPLEDIK